jgi:hypothetical protein
MKPRLLALVIAGCALAVTAVVLRAPARPPGAGLRAFEPADGQTG